MRQIKISQSITSRTDETLNKYLTEISHIPLISSEKEVELTKAMKKGGEQGKKAREELVNANLRFVVSVAKQYQHHGVPLSDLINEGNIGLLSAVERFDDTRGFKFISYAVWWIRQSILYAINEHGSIIRKPLNQIGLENKIRNCTDKFVQQHNRYPSEEELSEILNLDENKIHQAQQTNGKTSSIDAPINEDENTSIADMLVSGREFDTDRHADYESLCTDLQLVLKAMLNSKEYAIITQSYGIGCPVRSLSDIGYELGLTRERVRQIRERSLEKIRTNPQSKSLMKHLG